MMNIFSCIYHSHIFSDEMSFQSFYIFKNCLVIIEFWEFFASLYVLHMSILWNIYLASISSNLWLILSFSQHCLQKNLTSIKSNLSTFSLPGRAKPKVIRIFMLSCGSFTFCTLNDDPVKSIFLEGVRRVSMSPRPPPGRWTFGCSGTTCSNTTLSLQNCPGTFV